MAKRSKTVLWTELVSALIFTESFVSGVRQLLESMPPQSLSVPDDMAEKIERIKIAPNAPCFGSHRTRAKKPSPSASM